VTSDKPSWDDAPEWAQWLTQDRDGRWNWFEDKPKDHSFSRETSFWVIGTFVSGSAIAGIGKFNPDWRDTLEQRPDQEGE
jgi:hypothetical protein